MKLALLNKNECIIPICYAIDMGYFNKHGFEIEPYFHDGIWTDHDLFMNGEMPCIRGDYSRHLLFKRLGKETVITHTFSRDFQILSRNKFTNLQELDGKSCLLSLTTSVEFYLDLFCKENNIRINKVDEREIETRYERYLNEETELVMIPDPYASKLLAKGYHVLHDIRDTDVNVKAYMWDPQFLAENPDVPQQLMDIIDEATDAFNALDEESQYTYLLKYEMVENREEFVKKEFEHNLPFTDKSRKLAKEWFGE